MSHEAFAPPSFSFAHAPAGFRYGAVRAGIKPSGRLDFACAQAVEGTTAAAVFTSNRLVAAPLIVDRDHLHQSGGRVRLIAVNAGNANCSTGEQGIEACRTVCRAAAKEFGYSPEEIFPSSTGIIGVPLPAEKLIAALPQIALQLGDTPAHIQQFAEAILTTDKRVKIASAEVTIDGKQVRLLGVTKGSGMIAPQMTPHATMLAYLFTDAKVATSDLQQLLNDAIGPTFNCISVDGDTSTNDTVLLLASGVSGVSITGSGREPHENAFSEALLKICGSLARQIVADGEGADHVIELAIEGASSDADAKRIAVSIARSSLVKTAFAGCDPNWGRILAAAGYSGAFMHPEKASIWIGDLPVCKDGQVAPDFDADKVHQVMSKPTVHVRVHLGVGHGKCDFLTCDLTAEYVRINAEYST